MAIASKPPHSLHITVEGKSWDLIRLNNIVNDPKQNSIAMVVDLQQAELVQSAFTWTARTLFLQDSRTSTSWNPKINFCS
jgi:3-dehydroquinate synthase class II